MGGQIRASCLFFLLSLYGVIALMCPKNACSFFQQQAFLYVQYYADL